MVSWAWKYPFQCLRVPFDTLNEFIIQITENIFHWFSFHVNTQTCHAFSHVPPFSFPRPNDAGVLSVCVDVLLRGFLRNRTHPLPDEKLWLAQHPELRLGVIASRLPFEALFRKETEGIAGDYANRLKNARDPLCGAPRPRYGAALRSAKAS